MTTTYRWPVGLLLLSLAAIYFYFVAPDVLARGPGSALLTVATVVYGVVALALLVLLATARLHSLDLRALGVGTAHVLGIAGGAVVLGAVTAATQDAETVRIVGAVTPLVALVCAGVALWRARRR